MKLRPCSRYVVCTSDVATAEELWLTLEFQRELTLQLVYDRLYNHYMRHSMPVRTIHFVLITDDSEVLPRSIRSELSLQGPSQLCWDSGTVYSRVVS